MTATETSPRLRASPWRESSTLDHRWSNHCCHCLLHSFQQGLLLHCDQPSPRLWPSGPWGPWHVLPASFHLGKWKCQGRVAVSPWLVFSNTSVRRHLKQTPPRHPLDNDSKMHLASSNHRLHPCQCVSIDALRAGWAPGSSSTTMSAQKIWQKRER